VDDPVTVGLPLRDDAGIRTVEELDLVGAEAVQFRPLATWESGNLKWVLVDFLASAPAGETLEGLYLARADEPREDPPIANDLADRIEVDTGRMQVVVAKTGSEFLHRIRVDGKDVLAGDSAFEIVAVGTDGEAYPAVADPEFEVSLAENGPVKAVVVAKGAHRSASGARLIDYTLRLSFFRGHTFVRGEYTLRNANRDFPYHVQHRGVTLRVRTRAQSGVGFEFPRHDDPWEVHGELAPGEHARFYLAHNASRQEGDREVRRDWNDVGWVPPIPYDFETGHFAEEGYRIERDGTPIVPQTTREEFPAVAYADLADGSGLGVAASIRFGPQYWPVSFEVDGDGGMEVGLFSGVAPLPFTVNFYQHETREFSLEFHSQNTLSYARAFQEDYPLVARPADIRSLNAAGVLPDKLVTLDEENDFLASQGLDLVIVPKNDPFSIVRYWAAPQGGGYNQLDFTYHDLVRFWRTGDPGAFLQAQAWADYRADWAVIHSDNFVFALNGDPRFPFVAPLNTGEFLIAEDHIFDNQHRHTRGLPLLYYATGKERYRDAFLDDTEVVTFSDRVSLGYLNTRIQSKLLLAGSLAHRFTQEIDAFLGFDENWAPPFRREEILTNMQGYLEKIFAARYDFSRACAGAQPKGWSDEPNASTNDPRRFWFAGGDRVRNVEPKFMVFSLFPDALWNYAFFTEPEDPHRPVLEARILDLEHYFWYSLYSPCRDNPELSSVGEFEYELFDGNCEIPLSPLCADGDDFHPAYALETFAYLLSGDAIHLDRGIQFMKGQHYTGWQLAPVNAYRTDFLNFVYWNLHRGVDDLPPAIREVEAGPTPEGIAVAWTTSEPTVGKVLFQEAGGARGKTELETQATTVHAVGLGAIPPVSVHRYRVASRDMNGNWSASTERILAWDDFASDTRALYEIQESSGGGVFHDADRRALRFDGAPGSIAAITRELANGRDRGHLRFDFRPTARHGDIGAMSIVLMQNPGRYWEVTMFDGDGDDASVRLRKVIDGEVVERRTFRGDPFRRGTLRADVHFRTQGVFLETVDGARDIRLEGESGPPIQVKRFVIRLHQLSGWLDTLLLELG